MERKIVLRQAQSPGDIVVLTGAVRDLKKAFPDYKIMVDTTCMDIWNNNPYITFIAPKEKCETFYIDYDRMYTKDKDYINLMDGNCGVHFSQAYNISLRQLLKVDFPQTSIWPDIHLIEKEKTSMSQIESTFAYKGKFWIVNAGYKKDYPLKDWGHENYQKMVDLLSDKVQFVQIGEENEDHIHEPLNGVFNLVGKTDSRELIRLCYNSSGVVGPVSLQMHLAAAFRKPCITISGGREPWRWEAYPNQKFLSINGQLSCCTADGCWKNYLNKEQVLPYEFDQMDWKDKLCTNLSGGKAKCMQMIKPEDVVKEVLRYIEGGMA